MKIYSLVNSLLSTIESNLSENPTADSLSEGLYISSVHLQRLFKASFDMTLASYIRSRKLAMSLNNLMNLNWSIADIAAEFGFDHSQSYIRAFKKEFSITPGEVRKNGMIVEIKPPIKLLPTNELVDGLLFGPKIVYVPGFHCVGRSRSIPSGADATVPANAALDFWFGGDMEKVQNRKAPDTYIGLTKFIKNNCSFTTYTSSVHVSDLSAIPDGFEGNTIPSGQYIRFHYIGNHPYEEINADVAKGMYDTIENYNYDKDSGLGLLYDYYFEKIIPAECDNNYCKMEWFAPVFEK